MRRITAAVVMVAFILVFQTTSFAQGPSPPDGALTTQEIAERYQSAAVTIETVIKLDSGEMITSGGTGFFIDKAGHLITNEHVVHEDAVVDPRGMVHKPIGYEYWVIMPNKNRRYQAELVGWDAYRDTALMKALEIDPKDFAIAALGDSGAVKIGDTVYAMGNAYGLNNTFTSGIVSGLHRHPNGKPTFRFVEDYIQADTPINSGNSGGPLINGRGEVVGISNATYSGADGLHFFVPINLVDVARLKLGEVKLVYIGIDVMLENFERSGTKDKPGFWDVATLNEETGIDDLDALIILANLTYSERWAIVEEVDLDRSSPAAKAGLQRGDLIIEFNKKPIKSGQDIRLLLYDVKPYVTLEVTVVRVAKGGGYAEHTLKVIPRGMPSSDPNLF
ncbi:MAG: trypsin-like peptidase domain-containing protein [bacterium]|nr:trypsin-like peptidase domain-containing protein [bacterium]